MLNNCLPVDRILRNIEVFPMGIKQGFVITGKGERWDYINWSNALIIIVDVISAESNRDGQGDLKKSGGKMPVRDKNSPFQHRCRN